MVFGDIRVLSEGGPYGGSPVPRVRKIRLHKFHLWARLFISGVFGNHKFGNGTARNKLGVRKCVTHPKMPLVLEGDGWVGRVSSHIAFEVCFPCGRVSSFPAFSKNHDFLQKFIRPSPVRASLHKKTRLQGRARCAMTSLRSLHALEGGKTAVRRCPRGQGARPNATSQNRCFLCPRPRPGFLQKRRK